MGKSMGQNPVVSIDLDVHSRVKIAVLTVCPRLPVFPDQRHR